VISAQVKPFMTCAFIPESRIFFSDCIERRKDRSGREDVPEETDAEGK
jgi:hypothetical protein